VGHKTHPIGFRLAITKEWDARWFAAKASDFRNLLQEDLALRSRIATLYPDAGIAKVEIERGNQDLNVFIHTARPGIVIGRQGQRVEQLRVALETVAGKRVRVNVQEVRQPELNAVLVARNIADQLERRVVFRRAIRQAATRTMQAGAQGVKILCSGRLAGAEIARKELFMLGRVPLQTLRADIDYGLAEAATNMGRIGVKVWLYKGDILPEISGDMNLKTVRPIQAMLTSENEENEVRHAPTKETQVSQSDAGKTEG
jgi:small subunit ribosomal protein S3